MRHERLKASKKSPLAKWPTRAIAAKRRAWLIAEIPKVIAELEARDAQNLAESTTLYNDGYVPSRDNIANFLRRDPQFGFGELNYEESGWVVELALCPLLKAHVVKWGWEKRKWIGTASAFRLVSVWEGLARNGNGVD